MRRFRTLLGAVAGLVLIAQPLAAQDDWGRGGLEINAYYGVINGLGVDETTEDPVQWGVDNNDYFGGRLGYVLRNGLGIEGYFGYLKDADAFLIDLGLPDNTADGVNFGGNLTYAFQLEKNLQLVILGGAGWTAFEFEGLPVPDVENPGTLVSGAVADPGWEGAFTWNYGAAAKFFITRNLAVRVDWRQNNSPDGLERTRCTINGFFECNGVDERILEDETLDFTEWTAGLSYFLGGPQDADGDGVPDSRDLCPGTPKGVDVDANGCPFDDDSDGVPNYIDQCPDTPSGATVDATGCPTDSDGDGVFDGIDQCPGTPAGAEVDANGCTVFQAGIAAGELVLEDVQFRVNSSDLLDESKATLDLVGAAIAGAVADNSNLMIEVQGHASSDGNDAYNMRLSDARAAAVRAYLLKQHSELERNLTAKGYGETQPIADNATDAGRRKNRRVEFEVISR